MCSWQFKVIFYDFSLLSVEITVDGSAQWIKINHNQRSYFRVNYDDAGWGALIGALTQDVEVCIKLLKCNVLDQNFVLTCIFVLLANRCN